MYYVGFEFTIDTLLNIKAVRPICEYYHLGDFISIHFSCRLEPDKLIYYGIEAEKGFISGELTLRKNSDERYTVSVHTANIVKQKNERVTSD